MKRLIASLALTLFAAGAALAADTMTFTAKNGNVTFDHKKHQTIIPDCTVCHGKTPGKIEGFGKEMAHGKSCKGCHEEMKKGPTKCGECHKK
ncbi:cytochrome c7 [Geobacter anodireducens]|uniref:Cytochrome c3 family protein n=1 Tax=Geobacter anodireducens TaxID=1340425 RepID=A0ABR9NQH1_9BACT|nr:cytochrome c7 [Geobacter anodireducens]MBE2886504.1 cytochrome c3 family protein [Geobacter anodireducens]